MEIPAHCCKKQATTFLAFNADGSDKLPQHANIKFHFALRMLKCCLQNMMLIHILELPT
jgi:hypothetical protein